MTRYALLIVGLALGLSACGKPPLTAEQKAAARHMHEHAAQLLRLNAALGSDNLDAAMTPAYWLSRHAEVGAFPEEWWPHLKKMRIAAQDVEAAPDLEAARAAAMRVSESCAQCHGEADVDVDLTKSRSPGR